MKKGLSNIIASALILVILFNIIVLMKHNTSSIIALYNEMLLGLNEKFDILNENVKIINNGSVFIQSDIDCPIRYLIIYSNGNITISSVNNYSIRVNGTLFDNNKVYVVTCNGNIVRIYMTDSMLGYNASLVSFPVRPYNFQPGKKDLLDQSICPITFHGYNNSYGSIEVNVTFNLFCYNESGLVYDPPVMYFYNTFLVSNEDMNELLRVSIFSKGLFSIKYNTRNVVLNFLTRLYDALTASNIDNISYPNILNLKAQKAVQEVSSINNTSIYLYAWDQYKYTSIDGKFILYLYHDLDSAKLSSPLARIEAGFVITDKALIASASTLSSINYYVKTLFYNNSSFIVRNIPLNMSLIYKISNSSYTLDIYTNNGTILSKGFNETNIVLFTNKTIYEDKYISIILEKIWLYKVLDEPVASLLVKVVSKKNIVSVLAYMTRNYLEIYNDAYPLKPVIEPLVVQQYYDGKILHRNDETRLFIQARYITRYGGSPASIFIMKLPYITIVTSTDK